MDEISSAKLKQDIADILQGSDITTVTSKKIRKQLEEKYQCDLIERKAEIDKLCLDEIVLLTSKKSESSKSNGKDGNGSEASEESDDDNDDDDGPPAKKSKKPSSSGSKKPDSDDDDEVDDAEVARRLQEEEEENGVRKTRHGSKPQKMKKKRKKAKSSDEGSDQDEESSGKKKKKSKGTGRTNKYTEPCYLSPQLAAIMNETRLKRSDVVKNMWAIVKERNLYDPKNKQFMICDEQMQTVFGCKRVRIFGMMKVLKNHIFSPDEYEKRS